MWNLKHETNEPLKKKKRLTNIEKIDSWLPRGMGWRRDALTVWVSRCKLLHIEWIKNKA